jgi:hypothetical protein
MVCEHRTDRMGCTRCLKWAKIYIRYVAPIIRAIPRGLGTLILAESCPAHSDSSFLRGYR